MDDLIEALTILRKYDNSRNPTGCAHDVLYTYVDPGNVDLADIDRLDVLGFYPVEGFESFYSYRFGSA